MELDTGAGVSIISKTTWMSTFPTASIEKSDIEKVRHMFDNNVHKGTTISIWTKRS